MMKLDPELRYRRREHEMRVKARVDAGLTADDSTLSERSERVEVLVEFRGDVADLEALGLDAPTVIEHPTEGYKIAAGSAPISRLEEIAAVDHVVNIEGPRRMFPELDYSVPETHANVLHRASPTPFKGQGVVIGIIDSGFDWRHGAFTKADGTTRVLAYWHQTVTQGTGEQGPPGHRGVGVEFSQARINQLLQGSTVHKALDGDNAHGTHVAGIAAGNGSPATCCHGGGTFVGMAPEADLIVVRYDSSHNKSLGENVRLVQAMDYIFQHPSAAGKPVVINISLGDNLGAHDGTSLVERVINALVATQGRAVVKSAGNEGARNRHIRVNVPGNAQREITFVVRSGDTRTRYLDLWYPNAGRLNLQVFAPNGANSAVVNHGSDFIWTPNPNPPANRTLVNIDSTTNAPHNNDHNFRVRLSSSRTLLSGNWRLRLTNPNVAPVTFHCWIERGTNTPTFQNATNDSTISIPGTARGVIAVANYENRTDSCDCCPSRDIADSSSRGPVRRVIGAGANAKPDLAAPGTQITSAQADAANLKGECCDCCADGCCMLYTDLNGTSMAAPHVAGAIALMLQKNPNLTKAQILTHLTASAELPVAPPGNFDRNAWGAGRLDAQAAVGRVPAPPPPPTPAATLERGIEFADVDLEIVDRQTAIERCGLGEAAPPATFPMVDILRARVRALPDGELCGAVISRHFSEVRRLINTQPRIATMWHRGEGPALLRRLTQGAIDEGAPPPLQKAEQRQYLERFFEVLNRYASERLQDSLQTYRPMLFALLEAPLAAQINVERG